MHECCGLKLINLIELRALYMEQIEHCILNLRTRNVSSWNWFSSLLQPFHFRLIQVRSKDIRAFRVVVIQPLDFFGRQKAHINQFLLIWCLDPGKKSKLVPPSHKHFKLFRQQLSYHVAFSA